MQTLNNVRKFPDFHKKLKEFRNEGNSLGNLDSMVLLYLMDYINYCGHNKKFGGNIIKIDKEFKIELQNELNIKGGTLSNILSKLSSAGILYKVKNEIYQFNPYLVARGSDEDIRWLREFGVFRENVTQFNPIYRDKDEIIESVYKNFNKTSIEIRNGESVKVNPIDVWDILLDMKIITKDEFQLLIRDKYIIKNKKMKFEHLDEILQSVADDKIKGGNE